MRMLALTVKASSGARCVVMRLMAWQPGATACSLNPCLADQVWPQSLQPIIFFACNAGDCGED